MSAGIKETIQEMSANIAELHKELVTNSVKFDELRKYTRESIDEFKRLLERQDAKIETIEKDRIKAETELLSKINALEARLTALSEGALHVAAKEGAITVMQQMLSQNQNLLPGKQPSPPPPDRVEQPDERSRDHEEIPAFYKPKKQKKKKK